MMFQLRDDEDPESRAGRLARDRDHHAQVIKKSVNDDDLANDNVYNLEVEDDVAGECSLLRHRSLEGPSTLPILWSLPVARRDLHCLLQQRQALRREQPQQ